MPKKVHIPFRRDEIAALAADARERYRGMTIDEVALRENIELVRMPDKSVAKAGFSAAIPVRTKLRKRIPSLARPGEFVVSLTEFETVYHNAIIINTASAIAEEEVFWHEFYHLWYSPTVNNARFHEGEYSTAGALDAQEERRANQFAKLMTHGGESVVVSL